MKKIVSHGGFTLIEVLLALLVLAIAFTALMRATTQNVINTQRLKEKMISHWVSRQAVSMIQLGLLNISSTQESTQFTRMLDQHWYWRAAIKPGPIKFIKQITISVSKNPSGPFIHTLTAFWFQHA